MQPINWLTVACLSAAIGCSSSSRTQTRDPPAPDGSVGSAGSAGSAGTGVTGGTAGSAGTGATGGSAGAWGSAGTGATGGSAGTVGSSGTGGAPCTVTPSQLSEAPGRSLSPAAIWTQNGYAVAWTDDRDGNPEVYFARLDSEGKKLGTDVRVTSTPGRSETPDLAWASSEIGMVWSDARDGNTEIYFVRLDPAGTKLGNEVRVTTDPGRSEFPSLVKVGNGYAVAWNDTRDGTFQIYVARLEYNGTKLGQETRVSSGSVLSASPSLAASNTGFGVAWHDTRDRDGLQIYFARLDPTGARVGGDVRLSPMGSSGGEPAVASNGGNYAIAWASMLANGGEVQRVMVDAAGNLGSLAALTSSGNTAGAPTLIAAGNGYAMAWPDGRDGDREIYVATLDDTGSIVGPELRISNDATASLAPALARSGRSYGVAWSNDPTETTGEVLFATTCP